MRTILLLGTTALLLGGCALPVPLQIASWALDGISVLVTKKSVTDHGISLIAEKDCAIWRGVVEGQLCRDEIEPDVLVAENVGKPVLGAGFTANPTKRPAVATAPVSSHTPPAQQVVADQRKAGVKFSHAMSRIEPPETSVPASAPELSETAENRVMVPVAVRVEPVPQPVKLAKWNPPTEPKYLDPEPTKGIYFVIGSFRNHDNAARLSTRHKDLTTTVIMAKLGNKNIYRVVVGPVQDGKEKTVHKILRHAGLVDTWAMRVNPDDWTISDLQPSRSGGEVARLTR